jgi:hypothetical protein
MHFGLRGKYKLVAGSIAGIGFAFVRALPVRHIIGLMFLVLSLAGCSDEASLPVFAGTGPNRALPPPADNLIPTVNIAPACGWPAGGRPTAAEGTAVNVFADNLDHPRWLYVLPNGDVLVTESNAPAKPEDYQGLKGWITKMIMKKAGAGGKSANRITLLRDTNDDGIADARFAFLKGLNSPFGTALVNGDFYVANTDLERVGWLTKRVVNFVRLIIYLIYRKPLFFALEKNCVEFSGKFSKKTTRHHFDKSSMNTIEGTNIASIFKVFLRNAAVDLAT